MGGSSNSAAVAQSPMTFWSWWGDPPRSVSVDREAVTEARPSADDDGTVDGVHFGASTELRTERVADAQVITRAFQRALGDPTPPIIGLGRVGIVVVGHRMTRMPDGEVSARRAPVTMK